MADEPDRSHLPPAVRDAGRRADELIRNQGPPAGTPPVDPAAGSDTTAAGAGPPARPDGGTPEVPAGTQPPPATSDGQPSPPPSPNPPGAAEDWEQRYRTLQGKYDSEVVAERQRALDLERQLHQRQARSEPVSPPPPPVSARTPVTLTDEEREAAGPELVDIIRKAARAELQGDLDELDRLRAQAAGFDNRFKQAEVNQEELGYQRFLDRLDQNAAKIPWRQLQAEPEFREFILQPDRYSGRTRQSLLSDAANALDTNRVLAFYEDYLATRTGSAQTPVTPAPAPSVRLETQIGPSPGAGSSPAAGSRPTGRIWSRADISRFYTDRQKGVFAGSRRQEGMDLERDLFDAEREGRIS